MQVPKEQLPIIEQMLNLDDVKVLSAEIKEQEIELHAESKENHSICHQCGQKATEFHCHGERRRLRHLSICGRPVYLVLRAKRYRCLHCADEPTTTQRREWYDAQAGCTQAFAKFLLVELINSTLSDVAQKHKVTYDVLRGILKRNVSDQVDWRKFKSLRVLGLDEISLLKGHRDFVTIVSTQDERGRPVLLAVLEGREKKTVADFLKTIPQRLRSTIEQVCTDLYEGFANAVKEVLPQAKVVADRFHVTKLYHAAVDALRRSEMKELKRALKPEEYDGLKGVMWLLRRDSRDLTQEELALLELLFECAPTLRQAHALREKLTRIFNRQHTKESGQRAIRRWINQVKSSGLDCFDKFIKTLEKWMDEITNYFISRLSSGWVEGFNNKIKVLKRRAYGMSNVGSLFRRIWLDLNGYENFAK